MTDIESQRRYIAQVDAMRADFMRAYLEQLASEV